MSVYISIYAASINTLGIIIIYYSYYYVLILF